MEKNIKRRPLIIAIIVVLCIIFFMLLNKKDNLYKVTFDTDGGTVIETITVKKGTKIYKPADPIKEGHKFISWTLFNQEYDFNSEIKQDITLVAKWEKLGGLTPEPKPEPQPEPKPTPTPGPAPVVTKYTVAFNSNGGTRVNSQKVVEGGKAYKPANPKKTGYTFAGWTLENKAFSFTTKITKNITLLAKWNKNPDRYTIAKKVFQLGSPQVVVEVRKNGAIIKAKAVLNSNNVILGEYNSEFGVILTDETEYSGIRKIRLNDNSIVNVG